jgi:hypothetical protein
MRLVPALRTVAGSSRHHAIQYSTDKNPRPNTGFVKLSTRTGNQPSKARLRVVLLSRLEFYKSQAAKDFDNLTLSGGLDCLNKSPHYCLVLS